ncbi:MAG: purine-nucleoside phosphorylase [Lachnospiraceae bacterium]|nr:purine-nucleoside phosphorylase [Lachnospiraceae bacterium]
MNAVYEKLQKCYESFKKQVDFAPKIALVLGSGLGDYAGTIQVEATLDYGKIEGFPVSTAEGHVGRYVFGYIKGVPVVCMQGRVHYYEGYSITDVVLPIRLMKLMGAEVLFLTNASGGVNFGFKPGDLMLVKDHISLIPSPLIGPNLDALGERFPDMGETYDKGLQGIIRSVAAREGIELQEGVYIQFSGPQFETPAEIIMARAMGADAVGMSTACEAVAAHHMGMKQCAISCVTCMAAGVEDVPITHEQVQAAADLVAPIFQKLVTESIAEIAKGL